ncbi:hypothetical protein Verru16b_00418 [Lacunisphaera limnophila]|uniref:AsmA-like C-terminal domain-containing protein n=1 Tax=Lacunisphaera limnophila TaxID=1838286 RepID=A0A1D8AR58_9BACT|nr:hypothetical protein [Lacunisphaera limnophila]AOS43375.1 hypothetical protein Verru16b_00418 [Lacunisphaera limnophila]
MPSPLPAPSPKRRILWWLLAGGVLGALLVVTLLLLPPVQTWLLRRILANQPETSVEFSRVALGPGGAEAADVRLRLPNLTVEARALRLAISPWQLLSRQRLAIDDLQARQLTIRASTGPAAASPAPFTGLLESLQAPLAWACGNAQADGTLTLEQAGAPPIRVAFALEGTDLDITRPGRVKFNFTTAGDLVAGFQGEWTFAGTLDFTPAADGRIDRLVLDGRLTPGTSPDWLLPAATVQVTLARTPTGESFEATMQPMDAPAADFTARADFTRADGLITGTWSAHGGSALVAHVMKRTDLPVIETASQGGFSLNPATGAATATAEGEFHGEQWERFMPELAQIGRLLGRHSAGLTRRDGQWILDRLDATARSEGSAAAFRLGLTRPVTLPPGGDGNGSPWGLLAIEQLPLGWTAPVLGVGRIKDGLAAGTWTVSSPDAGTLRFTPVGPLASTAFTVEDATLPVWPPLTLQGEAHLDLTATTARLRIAPAALLTAKGDRVEGEIESVADLERFTATLQAHGTARLPTWLGTAQAPVLHGRLTADLREFDATVQSLHVAARDEDGTDDTFVLETLAPFEINYEQPEAIRTAEGDLLRFSARGLRLDWAASLLPGLSLSGRLAGGESTLRREGSGLVITPGRPWEVRDLAVIQGGVPLLRAPVFTLEPAGRVQVGADWLPGDFIGTVKLGGHLDEIFRLRDPAGPFSADGAATLLRRDGKLELRSFTLAARRGDGSSLLDLETLRPLALGATAQDNDIDRAADSLRLRTAAVPLPWLQPLLPTGTILEGTLEPTEFAAKIDLPNLFLNPARPLTFNVTRLADTTGGYLRNARIELSPSVIVMGTIASLVVENGRVLIDGHEAGNAGLAFMYFTNNLQIPVSASLNVRADLALVRGQPLAATLPLPAAGTAQLILDHDLVGGKDPTATFLLFDVPDPAGGGMLPRFGSRVTLLKSQGERHRARFDFQYQTAPVWSQFTTEFDYGMTRGKAEINATLTGDFFDAGRFMQLLAACTPAEVAPVATSPVATAADAAATVATNAPAGAFWQTLLGRFELKFGAVAYDAYRVEDLTGEFRITEDALQLSQLAGRMFDGRWQGNFRFAYDPAQPATPYGLTGGFSIQDFSAERIVQTATPTDFGSFSGRLHFDATIEARGANPRQLLDGSTSAFSFRGEGGRLQLKVPQANLASAALLVGGAITFSPELRAIGRLVKQFSDLPVDQLSARGRREAGGAILLDDLRIHTPQLRLSARGTVAANPDLDLAALPFELPVTLAVRDEMAVLLKGMKLIGPKPDADGFFTMTRQPVLRGTLGAPDTTALYDLLAQAASGSSGTFGFLMRKVQQEAAKAQADGKKP